MGTLIVVVLAGALLIWSPLIAACGVFVVSFIRLARSGIRCDAKGIAVRGLTLTHRFRWAEIVKFENREFHGTGVVLRQEGGWIQLVGPKTFGEHAEKTTEQLEEQRRLHQDPRAVGVEDSDA